MRTAPVPIPEPAAASPLSFVPWRSGPGAQVQQGEESSKAANYCVAAAGASGEKEEARVAEAVAAAPAAAAEKSTTAADKQHLSKAAGTQLPCSWVGTGEKDTTKNREGSSSSKMEMRHRKVKDTGRTDHHESGDQPEDREKTEKEQRQQQQQEQQQGQREQQPEVGGEKINNSTGKEIQRVKAVRVCSHSSDVGPVTAGTIVIRPFLRGKIHLLLFFLSPLWIFLLLSACSSTRSIIAAAISCISFAFNFFASALLHCFEWTDRPALQQLLHKLDHAGIFVVISGSTTPIPVLLLDATSSFWMLLVLFAATCYGVVSIIFGDLSSTARTRRAYTYIIVGLLHALFLSDYYRVLTHKELLAVFVLSTLYVVGALVYGFKWPDPFPSVYGFHEIFHSFCLLSFLVTVWLDYVVIQRAEWSSAPLPNAAIKEAAGSPPATKTPATEGES